MIRPALVVVATLLAACGGPEERLEQKTVGDQAPQVEQVDPLEVEGCEVQSDGTMTKEAVQTCVHAQLLDVRSCYIQALKADRSLKGKVRLRLEIAPAGHVADAEAETEGFEDPAFVECVEGRMLRWRFPERPAERGTMEVTYPVFLQTE
ncbi:MAG: AgmX/PglI C-terminal domain-containing protein [Myxococcota bacterium]